MSFEWVEPRTIGEAVESLGPKALLKAGGVDLMDLMKERLIEPARLVNIRGISGLNRITESSDGLHLGPLVTLAEIAAHPAVTKRCRALAEAAGHAATPQIRNMATAAGNLAQRSHCWYFRQEAFQCRKKGGARCFAIEGDHRYHAIFDNSVCAAVHPSSLGTALSALAAMVEMTSAKRTWSAPIDSLFLKASTDAKRDNMLLPGEMITAIHVPAAASSAYLKQGEKESYDWPLIEVAVAIERNAVGRVVRSRIVLGAVAHQPHRAQAAEKALEGKTVSDRTAQAAGEAAIEDATPLAGNRYKTQIAKVLVRRAILVAAGGPVS